MRKSVKRFILNNKIPLLLSAAILSAVIFIISVSAYTNSLAKKNRNIKKQIEEITSLSAGLSEIKRLVEIKEKKIGSAKHQGVVTTLEDILDSLGLKASKIKPSDKKRLDEYIEENAEVKIEKIDLNETVNLLYRIDVSPAPMKIKSIDMQTTFENRDIFILNLTVSMLSRP
jgi:predicted metal-dependent hydrolase